MVGTLSALILSMTFKMISPSVVNASPHETEKNRTVYARLAKTGSVEADLLVAADGSRSLARSVLFPDIKPRYAGYVAWRGVVAESEAGPELLKTFVDHFTFQQLPRSHILCYLIPGAEAQLGVVLERPRTRS
jgi:2-polyprenyl-6-methoxyphenol hydroxylase-like FAD-dependent oxidoreductase